MRMPHGQTVKLFALTIGPLGPSDVEAKHPMAPVIFGPPRPGVAMST